MSNLSSLFFFSSLSPCIRSVKLFTLSVALLLTHLIYAFFSLSLSLSLSFVLQSCDKESLSLSRSLYSFSQSQLSGAKNQQDKDSKILHRVMTTARCVLYEYLSILFLD